VCYLCGQPIASPDWNRDHVPPARWFASAVKSKFNPNLRWLPTHEECNSSYRQDEEYFTVAFAGQLNSASARAVFDDIRRGVAQGHQRGLVEQIASQFGSVVLPNGGVAFQFEARRVRRVIWKIVRGLYFLELGRVLPEGQGHRIVIVGPHEVREAEEKYPWWALVRDTSALGEFGAVLDFKWTCWPLKNGIRAHAVAVLFWDGLLALVLFHDPSCPCSGCVTDKGGRLNATKFAPRVAPEQTDLLRSPTESEPS